MRLPSLVAAVLFALVAPAMAQVFDTPEALIEAFYAPYFGEGEFGDETPFRSAALNGLYEADAARTPEGEMGALSFDPYVDGQDMQLADFEIGTPVIAGDVAEVEVTFTNFGEPRQLSYRLVMENGGWRIDDVASTLPGGEYRLTEILAGTP